jgi:NADH-quinone oxidoreductase subunit L
MVAAGVFLVARVYPLFSGLPGDTAGAGPPPATAALSVVTWVGAVTAVFAALIAVAQTDIKRILAYSTVSQLGYMMLGLGVGGVAVGMLHLLTHAFFKALLFLGAGSVIHGCHDEQDIRRMGGLRRFMPVTFATYAVGMMALAGFPLVFSGFWSKDEILHSALQWAPSRWPFYLGIVGAFLTAFYMTRQVCLVFFGNPRSGHAATGESAIRNPQSEMGSPHESPRVMTVPLLALAAGTVLLSLFATPLWPWFHAYLSGQLAHLHGLQSISAGVWLTLLLSTVLAACGVSLGWWFYGRSPLRRAEDPDALERLQPDLFTLLRRKFYVDEFYAATVVRWQAWSARVAAWLDDFVWHGLVLAASYLVLGLSWLSRLADEWVVDLGFDKGCGSLRLSGRTLSRFQNGQTHRYLRVLAAAMAVLALLLLWGCS